MYRIAIVDDSDDFRSLLVYVLDRSAAFEVCAEGATGADAIDIAQRLRPDVMIVDVTMPGMSGLDALAPILQHSPQTMVYLLSGHAAESFEAAATQQGASGVLEKDGLMVNLPDRLLSMLDSPHRRADRQAGLANGDGAPSRDIVALAIVPEDSAFLVEARSSVGLIAFGSTAVSGELRGAVVDGAIDLTVPPSATLVLPVASLTCGNALYDAEIHSRLHAQRYPVITAELSSARDLGAGRFGVTGELTIHGTTRPQSGTIEIQVTTASPDTRDPANRWAARIVAVVSGSMTVDIRDFEVELPSVLMLQIFPDVTVSFRVTAMSDDSTQEGDD